MWSEHCSYKTRAPCSRPSRPAPPASWSARARKTPASLTSATGWPSRSRSSRTTTPARWAVPGRGDRRGGDHPRHLHHGREARLRTHSLRFGPIHDGPGAANNGGFLAAWSAASPLRQLLRIPTIAGEVYFDASYEGNPLGQRLLPGRPAPRADRRGAARVRATRSSTSGRHRARRPGGGGLRSRDLTEESADSSAARCRLATRSWRNWFVEACLELLATGAVAASRTWARRV